MAIKSKKVARTIYLSPDVWDYIDSIRGLTCRNRSEEIEFSIKRVRATREQNDLKAIAMADLDSLPQTEA